MSHGSLAQLTAVITLILDCPGGLNILTGRFEPPTPEELWQLAESCKRPFAELGMKIDGDGMSPRAESVTILSETFERIIGNFGGWVHIAEAVREWAQMNPTPWRIYIEHSKWVKGNKYRLDGSPIERIADKYGISRETIWRVVKRFPGDLAEAILRAPIEHREAV